MTLDVEHLHSTVNYKQGCQTILQYARAFASSVKESLKSLTKWSAYYYTSASSWYPLPDDGLELKDLVFPTPLLAISMMPDDKIMMREWALVNGQVVRQRTVRQETTMAKAGTLPEAAYRTALTTKDIGNLAAEATVLEGENDVEEREETNDTEE